MAKTEGQIVEEREAGELAEGFDLENDQTKAVAEEPKPKAETQPEAKPVAAKPKQPEFVQITREQFATLEAAAKKVPELEGQVSKVFGTLGNVQETVKKFSTQGPKTAVTAEMLAEAYADMERDFPELAGHNKAALKKIFDRAQMAAGSSPIDTNAVKKLVQDQAVAYQAEALTDSYPDWREIVGPVDSEGRHDPKNPFRQWLAKQEVGYQHKVNSTNSAAVIERAINRFRKDTVKPAAQAVTPTSPRIARRIARVRGAVQPRGDGAPPRPTRNADDEFSAGFAEG